MITVTVAPPELVIDEEWRDLAARASSNIFMHPAALRAAQATKFSNIRVLLARDLEVSSQRLVGLWALRLRRRFPVWPATLEALPYNYAFLSSPVVDLAYSDKVMPAFLDEIGRHPALPKVIHLPSFNAEASNHTALVTALATRRGERLQLQSQERPIVTRDFGVKRSGSTRKKLRQDWNRLAAMGEVEVVNPRSASDVEAAFETFLTMEAGSWKGANGTALLSDAQDASFVRRLIQQLAEQGDASVATLRVGGRAIATQVLMYCGNTAYTWKTAFDQEFSKFSPGALLIDKIADDLLTSPGIEIIDSCSAQGSFMSQLWAGRRQMVDLLVDVGPGRSFGFSLELAWQRGYNQLRDGRNWLRDKQWLPKAKKSSVAAILPPS